FCHHWNPSFLLRRLPCGRRNCFHYNWSYDVLCRRKSFLDNAKGALNEVDEELEYKITQYIYSNPEIKGIKTMYAMREGEDFHIEIKLFIPSSLTVKEATEIKNRIQEIKGFTDVIIEFDIMGAS